MVRHRHGRRVAAFDSLHNNVAASSPYLGEPMQVLHRPLGLITPEV